MDTLTPTQQYIADTAYVTNDSETVGVLVQDGQGPADGLAVARHQLGTNNVTLSRVDAVSGGAYAVYRKN